MSTPTATTNHQSFAASQAARSPHRAQTPLATPADVPVVPGLVALGFVGAIFGFFYAWVCSTMWGLDAADPRVAIEAMQEMNASVRNGVFAPAFFGTPFVLLYAAWSARKSDRTQSARLFGTAALVYFVGGLLVTMSVNVPMNEDLAALTVPGSRDAAAQLWGDYSGTWQIWNAARTVFSGASLLLTGLAVARLRLSPAEVVEAATTPRD